MYSDGHTKLPETKVVALEVERKLWICRLSSYASRHYCIKVILPCSITVLICDEANNIFWSCKGFISKLHGSFSSLFSLWAEDSLAEICPGGSCATHSHLRIPANATHRWPISPTNVIMSIIRKLSPEIFLMKPLSWSDLLRSTMWVQDLLTETSTLGLTQTIRPKTTLLS